MTAITFTGANPTVGGSTDTWGTTLNTGRTQIKADLDMLNTTPTSTILGRVTASTGEVERLTSTQATTLINAVVGDSGFGGTKGLVPAPAAGDAAAEKYLNADGTWGIPQPFAWARINGTTGALIAGHNVSSTTRQALGHYRLTFSRAASTANFGYGGTAYHATNFYICSGYGAATTHCDVQTMEALNTPALAKADATEVTIWAFQ